MKNILVTGIGGPAGRATVSFFKEREFRVIGTDIVQSVTPVDEFHLVPRGDDPAFIGTLVGLLSRTLPMLLVPTVSEELPAVSRLKRTVRELGVQMFIPDPAATEMANDKLLTANKLRSLGIAVPLTISCKEVTSPLDAGKELGYPFLAKPRVGRGGRGVTVFRDPKEAAEERRPDIVFQEFIPGEECDVNLFAHPAGYVRSVAVLRKTAMKEGIVGNAVHVQRVIRRDVAEVAIVAARKLHLEGPIDMDIRRDRNGIPRILEINARVGANILSTVEVFEALLVTVMERVNDGTYPPRTSASSEYLAARAATTFTPGSAAGS